jgi:hypothetical protein
MTNITVHERVGERLDPDLKRLLVVGDKFASFSRDKTDVVAFRDFERLVWDKQLPHDCDVWLGQGIEHDRLLGLLVRVGVQPRIANLHQIQDQGRPSHQSTVHKARRENIVITRPRQAGETRYEAWLALQDSGELLADHMTGQHSQGMVLTEAARQMMLAVSELYLLGERRAAASYYFVLNSMNIEYMQFAFPLPTQLVHEVPAHEHGKGGSLKASCATSFIQDGTLVARVQIQYSAYAQEFINNREAKAATDAYLRHLDASPDHGVSAGASAAT